MDKDNNYQITKFKISLVTLTDIKRFVDAVSGLSGTTVLVNENETYRINAKSFLGAVAAVEDWDDIWVVSDNSNLYGTISEFVV